VGEFKPRRTLKQQLMLTPSGKTHNARVFFENDRYLTEKRPANELAVFITKYAEMLVERDM
jgi:hypothetical protein